MQHRFENSNGNQSSAMHKIGRVLCIRNIHRPVGNVDKSVGGCGICVSKIVGTDSYKQKRGNPNNKINHKKKPKISVPYMKAHSRLACSSCVD